MTGSPDVLVIGAGVSGLTTAASLAAAGHRVRIWTDALPHRTTSAAAGAMWGPYLAEPVNRVLEWSRTSLDRFEALAQEPATGVRIVPGVEASRGPTEPPPWSHLLPGFRRCRIDELPEGFVEGFRFSVPIVDMPMYLGYLEGRFRSVGGEIEMRTITSLSQAVGEAPVVVNCTGIGARLVVPDEDLRPIRGQLVVVANPGVDEFFSEETGLCPNLMHIYPQASTVVLGGVAEDGSWDLEPDPRTARAIVERCSAVEPRLEGSTILAHRVGLRPTRPRIRCEEAATHQDGLRIVHNYGHGGAGVTLSWGCAEEVVRIVDETSEGIQ
jgi:D-amino-acid oxidase